jgi:hypothetical protein
LDVDKTHLPFTRQSKWIGHFHLKLVRVVVREIGGRTVAWCRVLKVVQLHTELDNMMSAFSQTCG